MIHLRRVDIGVLSFHYYSTVANLCHWPFKVRDFFCVCLFPYPPLFVVAFPLLHICVVLYISVVFFGLLFAGDYAVLWCHCFEGFLFARDGVGLCRSRTVGLQCSSVSVV